MSRNLALGLMAGVVFVIAIAAGALVGDTMRDHGSGEIDIPAATGPPIPVLPGRDVTGLDDPAPELDGPYREIEVAAEVVPLDDLMVATAGSTSSSTTTAASGSTIPAGGDGSGDGGGPSDIPVADDAPPDAEDRGYSWGVEELDFEITDLIFDSLFEPLLRFLDFCAENPADEGCPPGVGGTVLAPFDDSIAVGEFRLRDQLYPARSGWWTCEPPEGLADTQYFVLLSATHPARIEIDYHPVSDPGSARSAVVDHTDPTDPVFGDFVETVRETGYGPGTGVHHCFVLDAGRRGEPYTVTARATSFTGETDEQTMQFLSREQRQRPPVSIHPLTDYEATLVVPATSEPRQGVMVRVIDPEEDLSCAEIEDASLSGGRPNVVPREPGQPFSGYHSRQQLDRSLVEDPSWRYDPAYDALTFWTLNLEEGSIYTLCVWWLESDGVRSFDPEHARISERVTRRISTPDRLRASIEVAGVQAPSDRGTAAASFTLTGRSHCRRLDLPLADIGADRSAFYGFPFCDFLGYAQPSRTEIVVELADGSTKEFAVNTPNVGEPRVEQVVLDLTTERASGLCGGSFGDCDPPTTTVPGPRVYLDIRFEEGERNGRTGWILGLPSTFLAPEREATELPDQIRIDEFVSRPEAAGRNGLQVRADFDRPVTLRAYLEGESGDLCVTDEYTEHTSTTMTTSHRFGLRGLCVLTAYMVGLEATDGAGTTTRFSFRPTDPDTYYWNGWGQTDGYDVTYQVNYQSVLGGDHQVLAFEVTVGGRRTTLWDTQDCLISRTTSFQGATWGERVDVEVFVSLADADREGDLCSFYRGAGRWHGSASSSFTLEEFMAGPILLRIPFEPVWGSANLPAGFLTVIIQGSVLP